MTSFKYKDTEKFQQNQGWVTRATDYIFMAGNNYYSQNGVIVEASLDPDDIEKRG